MTSLVDNRELALTVGYKATDWVYPVSEATYRDAMDGWDVKAIVRDDKCIGAAYFSGDEVHVSILPEWRKKWATKGLIAALFAKSRVTTRVTPGHEYMHGILQRLGFAQQGEWFVRG